MSCERALILTNEKRFWKTINQWEFCYGLFTNLPRIIVACNFSPSSFKLKRGILLLLTKYLCYLENYLSYKAKIFLVNETSREFTPCKISHICHCDVNKKNHKKFLVFFKTYANYLRHRFSNQQWHVKMGVLIFKNTEIKNTDRWK